MKINEQFKELVLKRLDQMPEHIQIHVGIGGDVLDKGSLIEHVQKGDEIGLEFIKLQMEYIKASMKGFKI